MNKDELVSIINQTKTKIPLLPFSPLKDEILGKRYSLSIAFIEKNKIKKFNHIYRKKNTPTNVLSFSLDKNSGELLLCPEIIRTETKKFERNFSELCLFLVIHGMLHLKGMEHSSKMETKEHKYEKKYRRWLRHRIFNDEDRGGRISKRRK